MLCYDGAITLIKILLLQGPNLNLLGTRETSIYGNLDLKAIHTHCSQVATLLDFELTCFQSNAEHELVTQIQNSLTQEIKFIIINPAAFTHTSIAIRDAFLAVKIPFIEVHLSNIFARENFRHFSYLSDIAKGIICGLGPYGYEIALQAAHHYLTQRE